MMAAGWNTSRRDEELLREERQVPEDLRPLAQFRDDQLLWFRRR